MFCLLKCSIVFYLGDHVSSYIGQRFCSKVTQWKRGTLISRRHLTLFLMRGCLWNLIIWNRGPFAALLSLLTENKELLLINLINVGVMSLVVFPRDQCWEQFYSIYINDLIFNKFRCLPMTPNCFTEYIEIIVL